MFMPPLPVSVNKNIPPEKRTRGKISFKNTKSGAGEQFMPQDCKAEAREKRVILSQIPV